MRLSLSIDSNGNRILKVQIGHARGFSIQTNGNLPITHSKGITQFTILELTNHIHAFGTPRQRELIQQTTVI